MPKAVQKPVGYATAARDRQNPLSHSGRVPGIAGAAMTTSSPATGQIRPEQSEKFNYLLFVTLVGTENPPIQRLLSIPSHFTFRKVHKVLQIAFGWNESHLHRFDVKEVRPSFCSYRPYMSITSEEPFDDYSEEINEKKITLRQVYEDPRHRGKVAITYQYDSAEDCGGSGGWGHLKECFQKPETDSDNRQKWFKTACMNGNRKGLDPWKWDMREVNKQLEKKFKSDDQDDSSSGEDFW